MSDNYVVLRMFLGVVATIGLYSVLYRENKLYRFFEHVFLGLAVGYALVAMWTETLYDQWWLKLTGSFDKDTHHMTSVGYWPWVLLLPIGFLGYMVFSKKYNWMSRIPIGIILGLWAGQQIQVWFTQYGPQINSSMKPILPSTTAAWGRPPIDGLKGQALASITNTTYPSQAIDNLIFVITLLSVLSYFLFSFDIKSKILAKTQLTGRWLLMIGFGAIFGSTVMMRFALLIDRMDFIFIEFLKQKIFHMK